MNWELTKKSILKRPTNQIFLSCRQTNENSEEKLLWKYLNYLYMGILNNFEKYTDKDRNVKGQVGRDGIGFKLTDDGNYDIDGKRLTNVADSIDDSDAVSLKVLKEHTQVSQNILSFTTKFRDLQRVW